MINGIGTPRQCLQGVPILYQHYQLARIGKQIDSLDMCLERLN